MLEQVVALAASAASAHGDVQGEDGRMTTLTYLGGLPASKPGHWVNVGLQNGALTLRHAVLLGHWDASFPVADITVMELSPDAGRVANMGDPLMMALTWGIRTELSVHQKDYALAVGLRASPATGNRRTTLLLSGSTQRLEALRQEIVRARTKLRVRTPARWLRQARRA